VEDCHSVGGVSVFGLNQMGEDAYRRPLWTSLMPSRLAPEVTRISLTSAAQAGRGTHRWKGCPPLVWFAFWRRRCGHGRDSQTLQPIAGLRGFGRARVTHDETVQFANARLFLSELQQRVALL